jgi:hypothetical protein
MTFIPQKLSTPFIQKLRSRQMVLACAIAIPVLVLGILGTSRVLSSTSILSGGSAFATNVLSRHGHWRRWMQAAIQGKQAASATTSAQIQKTPTATTTAQLATTTITYPIHSNINATTFWAGEGATADNAYISNVPSYWDEQWKTHFGGVDSPNNRNGYLPAAFTPKENAFYFALPYGEFGKSALKDNAKQVYWYHPVTDGESLLKNRWVKITSGKTVVYAQWEDVGPFNEDDINYVFGTAKPSYAKAGIDLSPASSDYLGMKDNAVVSWQFVSTSDVPAGPWKTTLTTSGTYWK